MLHTDLQLSKPKQFHLDKSIGRGVFVTVTQRTHWARENVKKILMQLAKSMRRNKVEYQDIQKIVI